MKNLRSEESTITRLGAFGILATVLLASTFIFGYGTRFMQQREQTDSFVLLLQAHRIVQENFYSHVPDDTQIEYGMIRGMLAELDDPYTTFNEPREAELDAHRLSGSFGGIGARINKNAVGEFILTPLDNHPAIRAGILAGDQLMAIDGDLISDDITLDEVVAKIRGAIGSPVTLTVRSGDATSYEVTITREQIDLPSVSWRQLAQDATIGVLDIERFSDSTVHEAEEGVEALLEAGVTRLILDLRGNGGGLLQSSVDVADLFLDGGVIVYQASRGEVEESFRANSSGMAQQIPLAVLVDSGSASAAEIVAAALQDHGRAALIGDKTFGKGSVQLIFSLADDSSLHVTNARWFTPDHRPLDHKGLTPDIVVESTAQPNQNDVVLARAVVYLNDHP
ncbi:MAG: S41 family peptidase [Candidatus Poseidoniia archaeon]|jgi:carboxyl-terminal processing protease|nr:S41 family peptidase [Candidatus Poseidoniia archaeon]